MNEIGTVMSLFECYEFQPVVVAMKYQLLMIKATKDVFNKAEINFN